MRKEQKPETQDFLIEVRLSAEDQKRAARLMTQEQDIESLEEALLWSLRQASEPALFRWKGKLVLKMESSSTPGEPVAPMSHVPGDLDRKIAGKHKLTPRVVPQVELRPLKGSAA